MIAVIASVASVIVVGVITAAVFFYKSRRLKI